MSNLRKVDLSDGLFLQSSTGDVVSISSTDIKNQSDHLTHEATIEWIVSSIIGALGISEIDPNTITLDYDDTTGMITTFIIQ